MTDPRSASGINSTGAVDPNIGTGGEYLDRSNPYGTNGGLVDAATGTLLVGAYDDLGGGDGYVRRYLP